MDDWIGLISVGVCIFVFLAILLGIGSFYGGDWETVSIGVAKFFLLIVGFAFAAFVLVKWLEGR